MKAHRCRTYELSHIQWMQQLGIRAIMMYAHWVGAEPDFALRDLLADLHHGADALGFDFDDEAGIAERNYESELEDADV